MTHRICGVLAPVVTPFKSDLSTDSQRFIAHCKWLISQNCGLAPFGTTSEANSMSSDERMALLDSLIAAGVDPTRIMPGTGCCSLTETVRLTAHAVGHGCTGVLMLPPFYYKQVGDDGLYRYFSEVIQRVGDARLRIYLYHIPPIAVVGITTKLVERLLKDYPGTIAGIKDSSGDWNNTKMFLAAFVGDGNRAGSPTDSGFDVFVGSETFLLENMRHGGAGTISATANVNPGDIHILYTGCLAANYADIADEAERRQKGLSTVREVFASKKFPSTLAAVKQAIAIYTNEPEWARVRPPLVGLTSEQAEMLRVDLDRIGFRDFNHE